MPAPTDKTRADLAKAVLREIRVLRAGEAPTAVQQVQVDDKYDAIYAELGVIGVAFWDQAGIPVVVLDPLSMLIAARLAPSFGKDYAAGDAMRRLYAVAAKPWSGRTVRVTHF